MSYEYFAGKADPDVYMENPFPKKIRDKETMQKYLDADEKLSGVSLKIDYYDTMLKFLEEILKQITNRTYQIKNSIEFMCFHIRIRLMEESHEETALQITVGIDDVRVLLYATEEAIKNSQEHLLDHMKSSRCYGTPEIG